MWISEVCWENGIELVVLNGKSRRYCLKSRRVLRKRIKKEEKKRVEFGLRSEIRKSCSEMWNKAIRGGVWVEKKRKDRELWKKRN